MKRGIHFKTPEWRVAHAAEVLAYLDRGHSKGETCRHFIMAWSTIHRMLYDAGRFDEVGKCDLARLRARLSCVEIEPSKPTSVATPEQVYDFVINAFEQTAKVPALEEALNAAMKENARLRVQVIALTNERDTLRKETDEAAERMQRLKVAMQQCQAHGD